MPDCIIYILYYIPALGHIILGRCKIRLMSSSHSAHKLAPIKLTAHMFFQIRPFQLCTPMLPSCRHKCSSLTQIRVCICSDAKFSAVHAATCTPFERRHKHATSICLTERLTPCSKVLLEKLTVPQLLKQWPATDEPPRFIAAIATARQLSLSWARSIQSTLTYPISLKSI